MSHATMIRLLVAALIAVVGIGLRFARDRRARNRPIASAAPGTTLGYASATPSAPSAGGDWYVREVRPVPRSQPPRIHLDAHTVAWFDGGSQQPTWVAPPSSVEVDYRPASTFGVNMPTAVITGPGHKGVRGRVTMDPRAPMGGFDKGLEEQMAQELIMFLAHAQQLGVKVTGKGPIPTPNDAGGRQTKLYGPPRVYYPEPHDPGH